MLCERRFQDGAEPYCTSLLVLTQLTIGYRRSPPSSLVNLTSKTNGPLTCPKLDNSATNVVKPTISSSLHLHFSQEGNRGAPNHFSFREISTFIWRTIPRSSGKNSPPTCSWAWLKRSGINKPQPDDWKTIWISRGLIVCNKLRIKDTESPWLLFPWLYLCFTPKILRLGQMGCLMQHGGCSQRLDAMMSYFYDILDEQALSPSQVDVWIPKAKMGPEPDNFRPLGMPNTLDRLVGTEAAQVIQATVPTMHPSQTVMSMFKEPQRAVTGIQNLLDSSKATCSLLADLSKTFECVSSIGSCGSFELSVPRKWVITYTRFILFNLRVTHKVQGRLLPSRTILQDVDMGRSFSVFLFCFAKWTPPFITWIKFRGSWPLKPMLMTLPSLVMHRAWIGCVKSLIRTTRWVQLVSLLILTCYRSLRLCDEVPPMQAHGWRSSVTMAWDCVITSLQYSPWSSSGESAQGIIPLLSASIKEHQPMCLEIMQQLSRAMLDADVNLFDCLLQGVSTGFQNDIPSSHCFGPNDRPPLPETPLSVPLANWQSAEIDPAVTRDLVKEEINQGWVFEFKGGVEAAKDYFPSIAVGRLGVAYSDSRPPRLVVDSSVSMPGVKSRKELPCRQLKMSFVAIPCMAQMRNLQVSVWTLRVLTKELSSELKNRVF